MSSAGLEIWNSNGIVTLNTNDRLGRILGLIPVLANTNGSISPPEFATGKGFAHCIPQLDNGVAAAAQFSLPRLTVTSTTVSWTGTPGFPSIGINSPNAVIVYGVF